MKRIFLLFVILLPLLSGCASVQSLENRKMKLEALIKETERQTNEKIAQVETEMNAIIAKIDKADTITGNEKDNMRVSELQEKVNAITMKGRDQVENISIRIQELENSISLKLDMKHLD